MLRAILIDDDPRDREILELLLRKYCAEDVTIIGHAGTIEQAYRSIIDTQPDLIFLDVELGQQTGFDLLSRFTDFPFHVV